MAKASSGPLTGPRLGPDAAVAAPATGFDAWEGSREVTCADDAPPAPRHSLATGSAGCSARPSHPATPRTPRRSPPPQIRGRRGPGARSVCLSIASSLKAVQVCFIRCPNLCIASFQDALVAASELSNVSWVCELSELSLPMPHPALSREFDRPHHAAPHSPAGRERRPGCRP